MKKKKNKFWLFLFSLWPGAGHMYLGFMKMGLSLMMGFLLGIGVVGITNIGILAIFPITLYIYSFFHANNLGGLDDAQFEAMEDDYLFGLDLANFDLNKFKLEKRNRKLLAVVLIILGISMLWNVGFGIILDYVGWDNHPMIRTIYFMFRDDLPRVVIGIAIIWFGVVLLKGKKLNIADQESRETLQIEQTGKVEQMAQAETMEQAGQMAQTETMEQAGEPEQTAQTEEVQQTEQAGQDQ